MLRRYRHRRGPYAVAASSRVKPLMRKLIWYAVFLMILYWIGSAIVGWISGSSMQSRTVLLTVEEGSRVNVTFDGGLLQPAETGVKIHPGDQVVTAGGSAVLHFFDGSRIRMDDLADLTVLESEEGEKTSSLELQLEKGSVWIRTPVTNSTMSGIVLRTIETSSFILTIPNDTEAVIEQNGLIVFSAEGQGIAMRMMDGTEIIIGEGQQIRLPDSSTIEGDPLRFRSAINPMAIQRPFIETSRRLTNATGAILQNLTEAASALLTVRAPQDNALVEGKTVLIDGSVDPRVDRVRVNGYLAIIDRDDNSFQQELSLRAGSSTMTIRIEALDARGLSLAETTRTIRSTTGSQLDSSANPESPQITAPALTGQTYRTQDQEIVIRGTAPTGAQFIEVNDYRLQLFTPGNPTWSYLAKASLGNLRAGRNVFSVTATNASGKKSPASTLVILLEEGTTGVVPTDTASTTNTPAPINESDLPVNDPIAPGTLLVTAPQAGSTYTATGTGFLLEGTTSNQTASVWVNGYRLQLYVPGKTFWNYIASAALGTLKEGTNTYRIVARNAQNQILDTLTYTVEYSGE